MYVCAPSSFFWTVGEKHINQITCTVFNGTNYTDYTDYTTSVRMKWDILSIDIAQESMVTMTIKNAEDLKGNWLVLLSNYTYGLLVQLGRQH